MHARCVQRGSEEVLVCLWGLRWTPIQRSVDLVVMWSDYYTTTFIDVVLCGYQVVSVRITWDRWGGVWHGEVQNIG